MKKKLPSRIIYFPTFFYVIRQLEEKPIYISEIKKRTNVSFSYLSFLIKHLEKNGFVKKWKKEKYSKNVFIELTQKGKEFVVCLNKLAGMLDYKFDSYRRSSRQTPKGIISKKYKIGDKDGRANKRT